MTKRLSPGQAAFTLVELLVVVGVIAVLIAMLLPVLSKVREAANRTKCASNLRVWGQAAHAWAAEHGGVFPHHYVLRGTVGATTYRRPLFDTFDYDGLRRTTSDIEPATAGDMYWQTRGTSLLALKRYGLGVPDLPSPTPTSMQNFGGTGNLACPSARIQLQAGNVTIYGTVVNANYMYTGGFKPESDWWAGMTTVPAMPSPWYTKRRPAVSQSDPDVANRILAADLVAWGAPSYGPGTLWDPRIRINHMRADGRPGFQNVLFGDGRVEGLDCGTFAPPGTRASWLYTNTTNTPPTNWSFGSSVESSLPNYGLYYYWGSGL